MSINYGGTLVAIDRLTIGGLSASFNGRRDNGLAIFGGFVRIDTFYGEQVVNPMIVQIPTSLNNGMVTLRNASAGANCIGMVQLTSTNKPVNFLIGGPTAMNGCTRLVTNAQSGGSSLTGPIIFDTIINPQRLAEGTTNKKTAPRRSNMSHQCKRHSAAF